MRGSRVLLFVLIPTLAILVPGSSARCGDFYSQEKCSLCHIRQSVFFAPGFASPETLGSFGEERVCYSCHNGTVRDSRGVLWRGAQHPPVAPGSAAGGKRCSPCHSPHSKGGWGVLAGTSISIRKGGDALCTKCHGRYAPPSGAIHRTGFPEGGCSECHTLHGGTGKALLREARATLCLNCHADADTTKTGGHPIARAGAAVAGRRPFPECVACHPVHRAEAGERAIDSQCAGCHAFRRGAKASGQKGHPSEAKCTECHSFHHKSAGKGKGLRRDDLRPDLLCGGCHATRVAEDRKKGREKGTHQTRSESGGKDLCLRCHRVHTGAAGTALLANAKAYSCLECHEGQNTISEVAGIVLAHPVFERLEKGRLAAAAKAKRLTLGPAGEIVCRTCHAMHGASAGTALLAASTAGEGSCLFCHERMTGRDHLPAGKAAVGPDCGTCHPVHGKRGPAGSETGPADAWASVCTACHARAGSHVPAVGVAGSGRPADMPGFDAKGRRVRTGAISCPTCHEPHGSPANKRLRRSYAQSGFVCTACHREKETVPLTPHDLRGIAGTSICEPCHRPHGGGTRWMWGISGTEEDGGGGECRSCHREKGMGRPLPRGGHPLNILVPRRLPDTFPLFGVSGERAKNGVMTCATCHEVHGMGILMGGQGTGMLLRAQAGPAAEDIGRVRACLPCHQAKQATHGQADCIWCHPPHAETSTGPDCRACHAMSGKGISEAHARNQQGCGACHRVHSGRDGASPERVCAGCHAASAKVVGTPHGELEGGPCGACHPAHTSAADKRPRRHGWEEIFAPDAPCLRCHREGGDGPKVLHEDHPKSRKKVPTSYGAVVTLETPIVMLGRLKEGDKPLFPLFEESGRKAQSGRLACLTCHDPHAGTKMKEGDGRRDAAAFLRDPSGAFLAEVCTPCHRGSSGERVRKFHDLPRKTD